VAGEDRQDAAHALLNSGVDLLVARGVDLSQPQKFELYFHWGHHDRIDWSVFDEVVATTPFQEKILSSYVEDEGEVVVEALLKVDPATVKALVDWARDVALRTNWTFGFWDVPEVRP
jgi:hypothetical protein